MPLPWQIEGLFLCVLPLAFGFGVWRIIDEVNGKAELYSQTFGFPVDVMPVIMRLKVWIGFVAGIFALEIYWKCRTWFVRKTDFLI